MIVSERYPQVLEPATVNERSRLQTRALYLVVAVLISIPCFWQKHIQADDLSSHLYNAWLVNEVQARDLRGIYVVTQYTNVLFDQTLSFLLKHTGSVVATERISVSLAVQIFFWGCFFLATTVTRRPAWCVAPFLAMLSYGAVFRMGFFNFYISLGICTWAIGLVWQNRPGLRWAALPLLMLAVYAHALPCLWAGSVIAYISVARRVPPGRRVWLMATVLLGIAAAALYIAAAIPSRWPPGIPIASLMGTEQLLTFGMKYKVAACGLFCLWMLLLVRRFENGTSIWDDIAVQVWIVSLAACLFLPDAIWLPLYSGALTYIAIRLSLLGAIMLSTIIAGQCFNAFERAASAAVMVLFFSFSYVDDRAINLVEKQVETVIAAFPPGARFVSSFRDSRLYVPAFEHTVDRQCIYRCFSFGNYEAATGQFRLRAQRGNPYVISNVDDASALEHGEFVWRRQDLVLYELAPCDSKLQICATAVKVGRQIVKHDVSKVPKWWTRNTTILMSDFSS